MPSRSWTDAFADAFAHDPEAFDRRRRLRRRDDAAARGGPRATSVALLAAGQEGAIDLAVSLTASGAAADVIRAIGPVAGAHVIPAPRLT